jgi:hypothetical protein
VEMPSTCKGGSEASFCQDREWLLGSDPQSEDSSFFWHAFLE